MEERDYMSEPLPCSFSSSCTRICNVLAMYCLYKDIPGIFHEQMVLLLPKSKLSMKAVETFCSPPNKPID